VQVTLVGGASYLPFGPLSTLTFGSGFGRRLSKNYDLNYGIDAVSDNAAGNPLSADFTLNALGNITGLSERTGATTTVSRSFAYDGLDRLTRQQNGATVVESFGYDSTGNRLSKNGGAYSYPAGSHRLSSASGTPRTYDGNGNTTAIGTGASAKNFVYDDRNRLREVRQGTTLKATYAYNGRGERVGVLAATLPTQNSRQYAYDEAGRLLGEYTTAGLRLKEYVWLDDLLVAILGDHDGSTYQYVETDHLGTPRAVVHPSQNQMIWRWNLNNTAFGEHPPSENPDGNGLSYTLNLRYPGQYYDSESGLFHNGHRDYEPGTGRYPQSDPIGLGGGMSTYSYVRGNPLNRIDPLGLFDWTGTVSASGSSAVIAGGTFIFDLTSDCWNGKRWHVLVRGAGGGFGLGFRALPISASTENVVIDDQIPLSDWNASDEAAGNWDRLPDALFQDSFFFAAGASALVGPVGGSGNVYQFGSSHPAVSRETSGSRGIEIGAQILWGTSTVLKAKREKCDDCGGASK
jgi:RHS repeat-associated protein